MGRTYGPRVWKEDFYGIAVAMRELYIVRVWLDAYKKRCPEGGCRVSRAGFGQPSRQRR